MMRLRFVVSTISTDEIHDLVYTRKNVSIEQNYNYTIVVLTSLNICFKLWKDVS